MADSRKFCSICFKQAPPDWNEQHCPKCGGRLKLQLVKKRKISQGRPKAYDEDRPKKARKPPRIKPSRKLVKSNPNSIFTAREKSVLGPRFHIMSPGVLLILNVLSMGLRAAFWMMNRTQPLYMMARPEDRNIKTSLSLWIASFCAYFTLLSLVVFDLTANGADITAYLTESLLVRAAAAMFAISFIINRHILYWTREVITDELQMNELDVIRSRALSFAPSPMLIWFVGVPYIQFHINRMIKKKGLNTYKPSRNIRVKKTREAKGHGGKNNLSPDLATEAS